MSEEPEGTEAPEVSEAPEATEAPEVNEEPEVTEAPTATEAPKSEEIPAEVQAFLDAVAKLPAPEDVTKENAEEIGEQVNAVIDMAEALSDENYAREDVTEALTIAYGVLEAVLEAEEIEKISVYDSSGEAAIGYWCGGANNFIDGLGYANYLHNYEPWVGEVFYRGAWINAIGHKFKYPNGSFTLDGEIGSKLVDSGPIGIWSKPLNSVNFTAGTYGYACKFNYVKVNGMAVTNGGSVELENTRVVVSWDEPSKSASNPPEIRAEFIQTTEGSSSDYVDIEVGFDYWISQNGGEGSTGHFTHFIYNEQNKNKPTTKPTSKPSDFSNVRAYFACEKYGIATSTHYAGTSLSKLTGMFTLGEIVKSDRNGYSWKCPLIIDEEAWAVFYNNYGKNNYTSWPNHHLSKYEYSDKNGNSSTVSQVAFYWDGSKWILPSYGSYQGNTVQAFWTYFTETAPPVKPTTTTITIVHEYYTNDIRDGSTTETISDVKAGQTINASDITKVLNYQGKVYEYKSATPDSLTLTTTAEDNVITLRYEKNTFDNSKVSVEKTAARRNPIVGEEFTYTITVTNANSIELKNVTITDTLPDTLTYVKSSDSGSYNGSSSDKKGGTVTWMVNVPANGKKSVTVTVKANTAGSITNTVAATWSGGSDSDDETVTATEKKIPYTLKYSAKPGDNDVENLPASETKEGTAPGSVEFTVSSQIPTREGYTFVGWEVEDKVLQGGEKFIMTASAAAISVEQTLWAIWKPEAPEAPEISGQNGKFRVKVVCDSTDTGHKGKSEKLRLRTPEDNKGIVEYTTGEVVESTKSGYEWQCTVTLYKSDFAKRFQHNKNEDHKYTKETKDTVDVTFYYRNGAWDYENLRSLNNGVEITYEKNGDNNYFCNYVVYHVEPVTTPELEITKTVDKASVKKGNTLNYTITVKNNGSTDAANVKVSDTLPEELGTNISNSNPGEYNSKVENGRATITWNLGTIGAGESKTVTFTATAIETGKIENHASVTSDEITTPVESDPVKTVIYNLIVTKTNGGFQNGAPDASCTEADCKSEDDGSGKAHVHYTVTVMNDSGFDLYGLDILDDLTTTVKADNAEVNDGYILSIENVRLDGSAAGGMVTPVANGNATHSIVTKFERSEVFADKQKVVLTYDFVIENTGDDVLSIGLKNKATGGTWTTDGQTAGTQKARVRSAARNGGYDIEESAESGASMGGSEAGGTVKPAGKTYTVIYKMNDGTDDTHATVTRKSAENSVEFTVGKEADGTTDISNPVRIGYVFQGWAETEDATTGMTALSKVTLTKENRSKTLYAVWTPKMVSKTVKIIKAFYGPSKAEVEAIKDNFSLNYTYTLAGNTTTGTLSGKDAKFEESLLFPGIDAVLVWNVDFKVIEGSTENLNNGIISFTEEGREIDGWTWIGSASEGSSLNDRNDLHAGTISMGLSNVYTKLPTLPTPEEVHDSSLRVEVICTTNNESWQYAANDWTNDNDKWYTLGQIEGDAATGYTCTLTLNRLNVWAGQLNTEDGPRHALNETRTNSDGILSTTLRWDAGNQKWMVAEEQPSTLKVFAEEMFTVTVNYLADNGHKFWGNNNPEYPLKEGEIYDHSIDETMTALAWPNKPAVKSPKSFSIGSNTYVLDPMAANTPENELTGTMGRENVVINLYYSLDVKGGDDPSKPDGGPDGIPDKYQVKVTFEVKNGAWNDETTADVVKYLTKYKTVDGEQVMAADGEAVLGSIIPVAGEKPDVGFVTGDWGNNEPAETTAITGDTTYTYTYKPAPGRVTITVEFVDENGNVVGTETVVVDEGAAYDVTEETEKIPEGYEPNGDPAGDPVTGTADTDKTVTVPVRQIIRYTVTYTDGVDGEEVFADQVTSDLVSGAATPAFVGTPVREGYTFAGWTPEVAATVTGNVTYTAQWTPVDPAPVDPAPVDPAPVDPTPVDPTPVDPTPVDPAPVDPTPVDPTPVDPAPVDPAPVDPAPVDPTPTPDDPAPTPDDDDPTPEETTQEPAPVPVVVPPAAAIPAAAPTPQVVPVAPTQPATPAAPEEEEEPVTVIDDPTPPLAAPEETVTPEEEEPAIVELEDEELPLAAGNGRAWALVNFALMNLAVFETLMLLIGYFVNTRKDEEEKKEKLKKKGLMRLISLPIGIISIIAFCLTEDISLPTGFVDRWTLLMAIIAIVQTVVVVLSRKKEENEDERMA
nr:InlB B-repeat-containing protein [uncultured Acetatifactor sp.]